MAAPGYLQEAILEHLGAHSGPVSCARLAVELCGSRDREVVRRVRLSVTRLAARGLAETWTSNGRDGWAGNPDFWERHRVRRNGSTFTQFTPRVRWAALPGQRPTLDLPTMDDLAAVVGVAR